jgi:hypothetical protein
MVVGSALAAAGRGLEVFAALEQQIAAKLAAAPAAVTQGLSGGGGTAAAGGGGGGKATATAAAAAAVKGSSGINVAAGAAQPQQKQQQGPIEGLLLLLQPSPIGPGDTAVACFEVGNVKTGSSAAATGEVVLEELSPAARAAGWSMEPSGGKFTVAVGEKKVVTVKFTAPADVMAGSSVAALGLPGREEVVVRCVVKGGAAAVLGSKAALAVAVDGTRQLLVRCVAKM